MLKCQALHSFPDNGLVMKYDDLAIVKVFHKEVEDLSDVFNISSESIC